MNFQIIIAFIAYFTILLSIGLIFRKKQMSSVDFNVGNRSLGFWVTALSAHASDMGSWLFMAFPAAIYISGLPQFWIAIGLLIGMFFNWQFVAKKLRTMTEKYESYTLSTFFEKKFSDNSGVIRILTALSIIFFLTCYVAAGLISIGNIFESVFGINFYVGLTVACLVITIYTFAGGFLTIAYTDFFQALFLLGVILVIPITVFFKLDNGFESILQSAQLRDISLNFMNDTSWESLLTILFLILSWGLGYFGQPHVVTKFMGIKNAEEMNKSKYIGMTWMVVALSAAAFSGFVGIPYFQETLHNPELVFIEMVKSLYSPLIGGFILCGVLAASISTMDSQILVCASVISEDFYKHLFNKNASNKDLLRISRIGVIFISAFSLFFAFNKNTTILDAVLYAWSGLGSAFGPLMLTSLYSKKANKYGAIAGIVTGGIISGTWDIMNPYLIDFIIPSMIPGFFISFISIFVISKLTRETKKYEIVIP